MAKKKSSKKSSKKKVNNTNEDIPDTSFLPIWAKKFKVDVEELTAKLEIHAAELKKRHAGNARWTQKKIYTTARRRLRSEYMAQSKSSAIPWCTNILYTTNPYDYGNKRYIENLQAYNTNPIAAKRNGLILAIKGSDPVPIDERKLTRKGKPNKRFGKPLPLHEWIMTIGGIASPLSAVEKEEPDWDQIRPFEMTVSRNFADPTSKQYIGKGFKFGEWYKCKATNDTPNDATEAWKLNATSITKWQVYDGIEIDLEEIPTYFSQFYCELGDLQEYHELYMQLNDKGSYQKGNQIVVTEGSVIDIVFSDDGVKNHRIVIDDESLGSMEEESDTFVESVNCWLKPVMEIDFGKYSRILIFGKTGAGFKKDRATGETLDEFNTASITVSGIVVLDRTEPDVEFEEAGNENDEVEAEESEEIGEEPDLDEISESNTETKKKSKPEIEGDVW